MKSSKQSLSLLLPLLILNKEPTLFKILECSCLLLRRNKNTQLPADFWVRVQPPTALPKETFHGYCEWWVLEAVATAVSPSSRAIQQVSGTLMMTLAGTNWPVLSIAL